MLKEETANIKDGYVYEIKGRGIIIKEYIGSSQKISIPEMIDNKPVTKIADEVRSRYARYY